MSEKAPNAVEIFYSYAHEDEALQEELERHLILLKHEGLISEWHDRLIDAGSDWSQEIDTHLNSAHIILLLVSPDFLFSDYCYGIEMKRALERHNGREARVIPIILRPCDWQRSPIGKLQALPKLGKPIIMWTFRDEAFLDVSTGIRKVIKGLQNASQASTLQTEQTIALTSAQTLRSPMFQQSNLSNSDPSEQFVVLLAQQKRWEQAEMTARNIRDSSSRVRVLRQLSAFLAEAGEWSRAESVARSIESRTEQTEALATLVSTLAKTQQWSRAEAVAYSIVDAYSRSRALSDLSRAMADAGEWGRVSAVASDTMVHPDYFAPSAEASASPTGAAVPLRRRSYSIIFVIAAMLLFLTALLWSAMHLASGGFFVWLAFIVSILILLSLVLYVIIRVIRP